MLRKLRIGVAVAVFALATLLFLDFTGTLHLWLGWLARIQFIPAVLAGSAVIIAAIVVVTLLFGRIYCSVVCPLGIMQDGISRVSARRKGKKFRFRYAKPLMWLRYAVLAVFVVALLWHTLAVVVAFLDPWGSFGRIAENLVSPLWRWGNNLLAWFAGRVDSYAFYPVDVFVKSWIVFGVAVLWLVGLAVLSWWRGRIYCNSFCPVGTILGEVSRFSLFRISFDKDKCTHCGLCEKACKSECIDSKTTSVDRSRCVACFDCIDKCNFGAIEYRPVRFGKKSASASEVSDASVSGNSDEKAAPKKGVSRRGFLAVATAFAITGTVKAQQLKVDGGLAEIEDKKRPERKTPIVPPGALDARNIQRNCVACQLCVSACPNGVLRPSSAISTLMQPEMTYERGYCRPECVECGKVCPTGAITEITPAEKAGISIGNAIWIEDNCVVNRDEVPCTECQRHCPTGAIVLVPRDPSDEKSLKIPVIDTSLCIGCGACENLCPARPFAAIYVEGNVAHHTL